MSSCTGAREWAVLERAVQRWEGSIHSLTHSLTRYETPAAGVRLCSGGQREQGRQTDALPELTFYGGGGGAAGAGNEK